MRTILLGLLVFSCVVVALLVLRLLFAGKEGPAKKRDRAGK